MLKNDAYKDVIKDIIEGKEIKIVECPQNSGMSLMASYLAYAQMKIFGKKPVIDFPNRKVRKRWLHLR